MPKEYIERGMVLEYLDADREADLQPVVVMDFVESIPAADVVEVVRCEKCRFYEIAEYYHPDCIGTKQVCRLLKRQMQEDDYCSYGERKDTE